MSPCHGRQNGKKQGSNQDVSSGELIFHELKIVVIQKIASNQYYLLERPI